MYVWGAIALLTIGLIYAIIRVSEANKIINEARDDVRGLAGDIVSLGYLIRMVAMGKHHDQQPAEEQEGAA